MISSPASPEPTPPRRDGDDGLPPELAARAEGLSKCYRIYNHPRDRLLQALWGRDRRGRPKNFYRGFWALRELSFSLGRGQTLGIVGRNGSGKSTLLQLLCGTLEPTTGKVHVRGRVGALLELGSGFNPDFSGLENVFLNAALLGLSKAETEQRLDQILAFADIGAFIHQPVKTYSSGMAVRLAFAVQAHIDPDVLVVDEALAVGDELFQKKCYAHLERLKERGTAVLLVTHSCPQIIQHCDQALLLHKGQARMLGEPARVTVTYQRLINATDAEWQEAFSQSPDRHAKPDSPPGQSRANEIQGIITESNNEQNSTGWFDPNLVPKSSEIYPSHGATINKIWIQDQSGKQVNVLPFGQKLMVNVRLSTNEDLEKLVIACTISNHTGQRISGQATPAGFRSKPADELIKLRANTNLDIRYSFSGGLWPGTYFASAAILRIGVSGQTYVHRVVDMCAIRVIENNNINVFGACSLQADEVRVESGSISSQNHHIEPGGTA